MERALATSLTGSTGRLILAVLGVAALAALWMWSQAEAIQTIVIAVAAILLGALVATLVLGLAWRALFRLAGLARVALTATLPWVPGLAALGTLFAYYALSGEAFITRRPAADPAWAIPIGCGIALALWVVFAALAAGRLTGPDANERAHGEIAARARTLRARFDAVANGSTGARAEAESHLHWLEHHLERNERDPAWASGIAYLDAWVALHRAEEALLEFASPAELEGEMLHDQLRMTSSRLGQDSMLLTTRLAEAAADIGIGADEDAKKDEPVAPEALAAARAISREVRHAINDFRHARWDGLVRARNRLAKSTQMTSWTTYLLLAIAIVLDAPPEAIGAGVVFYLVGAVVGLFARLRADARLDEAVEDYGLAAARLQQTVVASGLAAIAGVVLMGISVSAGLTARGETEVTMTDIFDISAPGGLLVAAVFGLAPNLLLERLRTKSDEYRQELGETAPVNVSDTDAPAVTAGDAAGAGQPVQ